MSSALASQSAVVDLPKQLVAEIEALKPFATLAEATRAINGQLGAGPGLRGKYLSRLHASVAAAGLSELLARNVGKAICEACDAAIRQVVSTASNVTNN